ncbi:MAG: lactate utilization protein [Alphaproteobacteria bacterium]
MSASRDDILGRVRKALGRTDPAAVEDRLARHAPNLVPARGLVGHEDRVALFRAMAGEVGGTSERLASMAELPAAIARYLASQNLPAEAAIAPDPFLDALPWGGAPMLKLRRGRTEGDDLVGITGAFGAVAETGTLVILSGPANPTTLNFLSETHVVVLPTRHVAGTYEEIWARLRAEHAVIPRTVNLITGPSRTADIEQTIQRGAHGPRRLHIVLVDGDA